MKKRIIIHVEMLHPSMNHLHMGHIRNYIFGDILSRYYKNEGYGVSFINKYDVFGYIPEHWAIVNGKNPLRFLRENIKTINSDFNLMNIKFTNKKNILTSDKKYVNYTQSLFRKLYKKGYIIKQRDFVIKCNHCNRILCNEEINGNKCIWCNGNIDYEFMNQHFIDINKLTGKMIFNNNKYFDKKTIDIQNNMLKRKTCYKASIKMKNTDSFFDVYLSDNYLSNIIKVPYSIKLMNQLWDSINDKTRKKIISCLKTNRNYQEVKINNGNIKIYLTFWNNEQLSTNIGDKIIKDNLKKSYYSNIPDWNIERMRIWGEKIPLLNCSSCDYECINEENISSDIYVSNNEAKYTCPNCGGNLVPSNNCISPWLSSSWDIYYPLLHNNRLNYKNSKEYKYADYNFTRIAHITKHILYTRFITKFLHENKELYYSEPVKNNCYIGNLSTSNGTMSRVRGNSILVIDLLKKYESDAIRLGIISGAKYSAPVVFNESYFKGSSRLINRFKETNIRITQDETNNYIELISNFKKSYLNLEFEKIFNLIQRIVIILEKEKINKKMLQKLLILMEPIIPTTINQLYNKYNLTK